MLQQSFKISFIFTSFHHVSNTRNKDFRQRSGDPPWILKQGGLESYGQSKTENSWSCMGQKDQNGLILVKEDGGMGFSVAGRAAQRNFPKAKPQGNPKAQPYQPEENIGLCPS